MNNYDYLFLDAKERRKYLGEDENTMELVTEATLFHDDFPLKKEVVIESIVSLVEDEDDKTRLEFIMEAALNKEVIDSSLTNAIKGLKDFKPEVIEKTYLTLTDVLLNRSFSSFKGEGVFNKDINKTLILCDMIENLNNLLLQGKNANREKIESSFKELGKAISSLDLNCYFHIVELALMRLGNLVKDYGASFAREYMDDLRRFKTEKTEFNMEDALKRASENSLLAKYTKVLKKENENGLNIILVDDDYNIETNEYIDSKFRIVDTIVTNMKGSEVEDWKLKEIIKGTSLSYDVSSTDIFKYLSGRAEKQLFTITSKGETSRKLTVAFNRNSVNILLTDTTSGDICYIPLVKHFNITPNMEYLYGNNSYNHMDTYWRRIKYKEPTMVKENLEVLTEGIKVTEDGGVRLVYKPKTTYMDDYAKMNRIIVQNARNNNVEGVKSDLVFLFSFINETEKIVKGKVKVKDSVKEDAKKARMFALGDFKQYLAFAQERDPNFDFTKYFEENYKDEGKILVEFSNSEIKGVKLLLRTLLG